ncbi:uncharacterized protein LOC142226314 [Haematobia irritans]|uniref:uncharacterized protein LOC142226314 n=1 Tax=Haematobia irritans TaxID=7368 RepID=UPI003F5034C5
MTTRIMSSVYTSTSSMEHDDDSNRGVGDNANLRRTSSAESAKTTTTTITSDPGILCFHHCNVKVFCFTLPHICPQCRTPLDTYPSGGDGGSGTGGGGQSGSRGHNKRHKTKKRTTTTNNSLAAITKGHQLLKNNTNNNSKGNSSSSSSNGDVNTDNNRKDNAEHNDLDSDHHYGDTKRDEENDVDDDDDDGEDSNDNDDLVSHIMASRLLPFRLPYPFVRANQYPCAIVLRPTTGDFLNDYNNTTDLHIAVTTSTGCVVEFDRHGLRRHRTNDMSDWWQCLLVGDVPEPWYDYWDQVLFEVCQQQDKWTVSHYHEDKHNCYTFVLTFLQALTYDKLSEAATSKTTFCEKFIVPRTTTAGKYISLYRKLRDTGIYVHHTTHHNKLRNTSFSSSGPSSSSASYLSYGNSTSKTGKYQQHQRQEEAKEQLLMQPTQEHNKFNNSEIASPMGSLDPSSTQQRQRHQHYQQKFHQQQHLNQKPQQQKQHQHQNHQQQQQQHHHSIISRPHSTLCTIEE